MMRECALLRFRYILLASNLKDTTMISNPRYPHQVVISVLSGRKTAFDEGQSTILFSGACRNYIPGNPSSQGKVIESDYILAIPTLLQDIKAGCKVKLTDKVRTIEGTVIEMITNNLGTNIYWNKDGN